MENGNMNEKICLTKLPTISRIAEEENGEVDYNKVSLGVKSLTKMEACLCSSKAK
jgi:hypothetical protein